MGSCHALCMTESLFIRIFQPDRAYWDAVRLSVHVEAFTYHQICMGPPQCLRMCLIMCNMQTEMCKWHLRKVQLASGNVQVLALESATRSLATCKSQAELCFYFASLKDKLHISTRTRTPVQVVTPCQLCERTFLICSKRLFNLPLPQSVPPSSIDRIHPAPLPNPRHKQHDSCTHPMPTSWLHCVGIGYDF